MSELTREQTTLLCSLRGPENILFTKAIKNFPLREITCNFGQVSSGYFLRLHLYWRLERLPWNFAFSPKEELWNFRISVTGGIQCICRLKLWWFLPLPNINLGYIYYVLGKIFYVSLWIKNYGHTEGKSK